MTNKYKLIILPGWGGSQKTWAAFITRIEPLFSSVTVIDLPCFGNEPCPKEVWGVEEYAGFVKKTIAQIPTDSSKKTVLLGHSFGGQIAAYLAATEPSICDILILSGAALYRPKKSIKRAIFWALAKTGKAFFSLPLLRSQEQRVKRMLYKVADSPDYEKTKDIQREIFKKVIRQDTSHVLSKISCPTALVWGEHDRYTPLAFVKKIQHAVPLSTAYIIKKGSHGLHIHKPSEFAEIIQTIIETS